MQRWLDIIHCISLWHRACELQNKLSPLPSPLTSNPVVLLVALVRANSRPPLIHWDSTF